MRFGKTPEKDEINHYGEVARSIGRHDELAGFLKRASELDGRFGGPPVEPWLDNYYDSVAQAEVYEFLRDRVVGGAVLQMGGTGKEVLKTLIGGAEHGFLVTPVQGEAELASGLATEFGVGGRFDALVGSGEDLPLPDDSVDVVISEGCLHHTEVGVALIEARRVLREGGRFGAWDPWHARLYDIGTAVFGKREPGIECRPLNPARLATLHEVFPDATISQHGALVRYPLIALGKLGWVPDVRRVQSWTRFDDRLSSHWKVLQRNGSCASVLAEKR